MTGHSSSSIKKMLNNVAGVNGSDKEWKRSSKSLNDKGECERVFEHTGSGKCVRTTEHADGTLSTCLVYDVDKALIKKKKAAKYCFAIAGSEDGSVNVAQDIMIYITPINYYEKHKYCDDQPHHLYDLLPVGADDINECGNYLMPRRGKTDSEIAQDLMTRGFVWRADFQNLVYKGLNPHTFAQLETLQATSAPAVKPAAARKPKR